MDLRQLEYFVAIVREGSLTAAAKRCRVAQPSLSQQLRLLEEELGEALVVRKPRGVEPTAAGLLLLERAEGLLRQAKDLKNHFQQRREMQEGRVDFGIIPTMAPYLLPRFLGPFRKEFPLMDVQVREAKTQDLIRMVVDGSLGFAILSDVTEQDQKRWSVHVRELFREPLMLAVPADHELATRKKRPVPADLDGEMIVHLQDGHCLTDRTLQVCRLGRFDPRLACDQLETALTLVGAGMGVAIVPRFAMQFIQREGVVVRKFAKPVPERAISVMRSRARKISTAEKELIELVKGLGG